MTIISFLVGAAMGVTIMAIMSANSYGKGFEDGKGSK